MIILKICILKKRYQSSKLFSNDNLTKKIVDSVNYEKPATSLSSLKIRRTVPQLSSSGISISKKKSDLVTITVIDATITVTRYVRSMWGNPTEMQNIQFSDSSCSILQGIQSLSSGL